MKQIKEKLAWTKFYPSDHLNDMELSSVSLAAQGFWVRLWALMHKSEVKGYLQINGKAATPEQISRVTGVPVHEVKKYLKELGEAGVYSKTKNGIIYCRRMVRDTGISQDAVKSGRRGYIAKLQNELEALPAESPRRDEILAEFKRLRHTPKTAAAGNGAARSKKTQAGKVPDGKIEYDGKFYYPNELAKLQKEIEAEKAKLVANQSSGSRNTKNRISAVEYNKHLALLDRKLSEIKAARGIPSLPQSEDSPPAPPENDGFYTAEKSNSPVVIEAAIRERQATIASLERTPKDNEFVWTASGKMRKTALESIASNRAAIERLQARLETLNPVPA